MIRALSLLIAALLTSTAAFAHHSFAMFDLEKEITLKGAVKEFHWTNPHVWLEINVKDDQGRTTTWGFEMGAPGMLARPGWKSRTVKPGDEVTVITNPLKTGEPRGRLVRVTLPDGRVMGPGGIPPSPPAANNTRTPETSEYTIAYATFAPLNTAVFVANADGSSERVLVPGSVMDSNASFSPDGNSVLFTSRRNGSADIYRVRIDGSQLERLTDDK